MRKLLWLALLSGCAVVHEMAEANLKAQLQDEAPECQDIRVTAREPLKLYVVNVCGEHRSYVYIARDGEFKRVDASPIPYKTN